MQLYDYNSSPISSSERLSLHLLDSHLTLELRREYLIADFFDQAMLKSKDLWKPLRIRFVHSGEEGMDQGGLQKEFFVQAAPLMFDAEYGMFTYNERTRLRWINGYSDAPLSHFYILGIFLGLAIYNGVVVDIGLPCVFWKLLLNEKIGFSDLAELDPEVFSGLKTLLEWSDDDVEHIFCRNFEISVIRLGKEVSVELKPGGADLPVTNENRQGICCC